MNTKTSYEETADGLFESTSRLEMDLLPGDFSDGGQIILKCVSRIDGVYEKFTELRIGARNGDPVPERGRSARVFSAKVGKVSVDPRASPEARRPPTTRTASGSSGGERSETREGKGRRRQSVELRALGGEGSHGETEKFLSRREERDVVGAAVSGSGGSIVGRRKKRISGIEAAESVDVKGRKFAGL